jgi:hypothetical protein
MVPLKLRKERGQARLPHLETFPVDLSKQVGSLSISVAPLNLESLKVGKAGLPPLLPLAPALIQFHAQQLSVDKPHLAIVPTHGPLSSEPHGDQDHSLQTALPAQ